MNTALVRPYTSQRKVRVLTFESHFMFDLLARLTISTTLVLGMLSVATAQSTTATRTLNQKEERSAAESLKALRAELDAAGQAWIKKYQEATNDTDRADLNKNNPNRAFEPRFLSFARTYPSEPSAMEAVQWLVETANPGPVFDEALLFVERHRIQDKQVAKICQTLVDRFSPGIEPFLLAVAAKNSDHEVQGVAYLVLVRYLRSSHSMAVKLRGTDDSQRARVRQEYSEDIAAWMLSADPDRLAAQIDDVCQKLVRNYGDVSDSQYAEATGKRRSLADAAKAVLFSFRPIGQIALDTTGVGLDKAAVSLSDQRGKVVVLMFSANWCGPCKAMYGQLRELVRSHSEQPFSVMTIMADNELSTVSKAVDSGEIAWPVIWDGKDGPIAHAWNITKYPTIYLIDRDGRIVAEGLREDGLDDEVARLLGVSSKSRIRVDKRNRVWQFSIKDKNVSGKELATFLEGYTEVRELDVSHNPISDEDLVHLLPLKKLTVLNLEHTNVTDKGLQILKGLPNLKELRLYVSDAQGTTAAGRRALSNAIPGLKITFTTN